MQFACFESQQKWQNPSISHTRLRMNSDKLPPGKYEQETPRKLPNDTILDCIYVGYQFFGYNTSSYSLFTIQLLRVTPIILVGFLHLSPNLRASVLGQIFREELVILIGVFEGKFTDARRRRRNRSRHAIQIGTRLLQIVLRELLIAND